MEAKLIFKASKIVSVFIFAACTAISQQPIAPPAKAVLDLSDFPESIWCHQLDSDSQYIGVRFDFSRLQRQETGDVEVYYTSGTETLKVVRNSGQDPYINDGPVSNTTCEGGAKLSDLGSRDVIGSGRRRYKNQADVLVGDSAEP